MFTSTYMSALVAAASLISFSAADDSSSPSTTIQSIATPTASYSPNSMTDIGCFEDATPLQDHGEYLFQSQGNCQGICILLKKPVLGLVDGTNCYCGDLIPAKDAQVDNKTCNTPCSGIDTDNCGGNKKWWVSLTGITRNQIDYYEPVSSSSSLGPSSTPISTGGASTIYVPAPTTSAAKKGDGGPNKAGIAAGVVVGVVVLAAIIGGVILYLKQKKRRELEEEHLRQANLNSFVAGSKGHTSNSSMNDSRLDPEMMRRQSSGSIADNEDYSRRILKVTNF